MNVYLLSGRFWKLFENVSQEELKKRNIRIGSGVRICSGVRIGSDVRICSGVCIGSGVRICSGVCIGSGVRIDSGIIVLKCVSIMGLGNSRVLTAVICRKRGLLVRDGTCPADSWQAIMQRIEKKYPDKKHPYYSAMEFIKNWYDMEKLTKE